MDSVASILKYELHRLLVDGIKYERIKGGGPESEWEMMLFKNEELINYLNAMQVTKSVYEFVAYDSDVEREFARKLDAREDIKLFGNYLTGLKLIRRSENIIRIGPS